MPQSTQCIHCRHYLGGLTCTAFPQGIPKEILSGEHDHREPYDGDQGIRWEQDPRMPDLEDEEADDDE